MTKRSTIFLFLLMFSTCGCLGLGEKGISLEESLSSRMKGNASQGYETFSQTFMLKEGGERFSADILPMDIVFDNDSTAYHFEVDPVYGMSYRSEDYSSSITPHFFKIAYEYAGARVTGESTEGFEGWDIRIDVEEEGGDTFVEVGYRMPLQPTYTVKGKVRELLEKGITGARLSSRLETNCHASDFKSSESQLEISGREVSLAGTTNACTGEVESSEETFNLMKDERPLQNISQPFLTFGYSTTDYITNRYTFENSRRQDDFGIGNVVSEKLVGTVDGGEIEASYASYFDVILGEVQIGGEQYLFSLNANLNLPIQGQVFLSSMFPSLAKSTPKEVPRIEDFTADRPQKMLEMEIDKTKG